METIIFNCRFITPAFLGGADPKGTPELRPPSIKGALRFWWRAMNGHFVENGENGKPTFRKLLENDETLFGGINQVMQKSPVTVRAVEKEMNYIEGQKIVDHRQYEGIDYLFYTFKHHKKDDLGFNTGSQFDVIFSCLEKDHEILLKTIASFWLLVNLGSLGTRARRGAGAFSVDGIIDRQGILNNGLSFFPETGMNTIVYLKNNFSRIKEMIGSNKKASIKKYSLLNQETPAYLSTVEFNTWQEAVNAIGTEMKTIRKGKTSKYKAERTFTMDTLNKKAAFGIPVGVFSDNPVTFETNERRASPIYLSVVFNKTTRKYHWVVTHFEGDFMPSDDKIVFTSKNRNVRKNNFEWPKEDNSLVLAFMNKIKSKSQKI
ncbi:MAG: type III-B CRISPR module RAMP protein Cmr1 [Saprospiraceae bacterium]|nr:type III-B CRISPR module RAMP protein Cmr1 [Saprospiraceae bacterium]MCF8249252.1 type III-B CRISPR module RAMP protein Cmr1 [Saprospiraceae bacterium]MCF8281180.1 type III-B CRISPR module RAMP protein Cmr1 [Bacteroidales bacterium]MCF8311471.1 type III-B CRISPR module RAMP protein Cmr1 [Saprospiraceae bacterium]MCF8439871.1 type III-B CRISPR module RAMP protein Cmr1 [Saprospiraceae bacterium]